MKIPMKALLSDAKKFKEDRVSFLGKLTFVFAAQIAVSILLTIDLTSNDELVFYCFPSVNVVMARFVCGAFLHFKFLTAAS